MFSAQNFQIALTALWANKLRAALTVLGITIGVAAVILLQAVGDGVTRFVAEQFSGLGANIAFIIPQQDEFGPPGSDPLLESSLTLRDAEFLGQPGVIPDAVRVAPLELTDNVLQYEGNFYRTTVLASTPAYFDMRNYVVERGRAISDDDYFLASRVVVLGLDVVAELFPPDVDPVGADIKINGLRYQVVGILETKGSGGFGQSQDDVMLIPFTAAQGRLFNARSRTTGELTVDIIAVEAVEGRMEDAIIDATDALRQRHNISFRDEDDFTVLTQQDFLNAFGAITNLLSLFLVVIASISLLVGGIGVMNIMLVSVTERTREIGLRKAVGAKQSNILGQFLAEAVLLTLFGGILGITVGAIGAWGVRLAIPNLDTAITLGAVVLAVGVSSAVGLTFGLYPAWRASRLNPIDALRFE